MARKLYCTYYTKHVPPETITRESNTLRWDPSPIPQHRDSTPSKTPPQKPSPTVTSLFPPNILTTHLPPPYFSLSRFSYQPLLTLSFRSSSPSREMRFVRMQKGVNRSGECRSGIRRWSWIGRLGIGSRMLRRKAARQDIVVVGKRRLSFIGVDGGRVGFLGGRGGGGYFFFSFFLQFLRLYTTFGVMTRPWESLTYKI